MQIPFFLARVQRAAATTVVRCNLMSATLLNRKQQHWLVCSLLLGWQVFGVFFFSLQTNALICSGAGGNQSRSLLLLLLLLLLVCLTAPAS